MQSRRGRPRAGVLLYQSPYEQLYGGLVWFATRGTANAWKRAPVQGTGRDLVQLVVHRTGVAPRARSARAEERSARASAA